jgi:hypothetical protein
MLVGVSVAMATPTLRRWLEGLKLSAGATSDTRMRSVIVLEPPEFEAVKAKGASAAVAEAVPEITQPSESASPAGSAGLTEQAVIAPPRSVRGVAVTDDPPVKKI